MCGCSQDEWTEAIKGVIANGGKRPGAAAAAAVSAEEQKERQLADQYGAAFRQKAPEGQVTFVFTDVQNSTKLWEHAQSGMNKGLEKHDALMRMLLKQFNGYEVKTEGDAFMVTFFSVLDAVRWCLAVQRGLLDIVWPDGPHRRPPPPPSLLPPALTRRACVSRVSVCADLLAQSSANKEYSKDGSSSLARRRGWRL